METLCFYMQVKYIKGKFIVFFHEFQKNSGAGTIAIWSVLQNSEWQV